MKIKIVAVACRSNALVQCEYVKGIVHANKMKIYNDYYF